ncbi:MAG: PilT/PilU family type 4a pilus ATPase [Patescibacteria group bacterium]|jgi:twitching motility protein PilT|nr:PilT/PilU family type 4a pilus ATPase [Patescibacteria group bacterium]
MDSSLNVFLNKVLITAAKRKASTVHLTVNSYPALRVDEELVELNEESIVTDSLVNEIAKAWLTEEQKKILEDKKEIVVAKQMDKKFRMKVSFFFQKGFLSANIRLIPGNILPLINLGLPKSVYSLTDRKSGLIIVSGPYGSGRTTTVAAMLEEINQNRKENIVTIEKPIEYIFANKKSLVEQREVGRDTNSFTDALKYVQNADIDIISVGLTNELEAIPLVLEFASSGRLAFLTMNTNSVAQTIEEILALFPADEQDRARLLLAKALASIIVQRLVPRAGGGLAVATEVLIATEAVQSLISQNRVRQIETILQSSREEGMISLDQSLAQLVKSGEVLIDQAIEYANDPAGVRAMAKA